MRNGENKQKKTKQQKIIHTKVNEHLSKALPHVLRHRQDTGDVVVEEGILLLEAKFEEKINITAATVHQKLYNM